MSIGKGGVMAETAPRGMAGVLKFISVWDLASAKELMQGIRRTAVDRGHWMLYI